MKTISTKMKAAAKEDATYQASLRQYLEKFEKKVLEQDAKNTKSLSEGIKEVGEQVKATSVSLHQQHEMVKDLGKEMQKQLQLQQQQQQQNSGVNSDDTPQQKRAGECYVPVPYLDLRYSADEDFPD